MAEQKFILSEAKDLAPKSAARMASKSFVAALLRINFLRGKGR